jgi:hypothetical protein
MNQQQVNKSPRTGMSRSVVAVAIVSIVILGGCFYGVLAYIKSQNNTPTPSGNQGMSSMPGSSSGGMGSDCSGGGPCTGLNSGGPSGCTNSGPCTQTSGGQQVVAGKITAVSATSISVQPADGGSAKTFAVTSATKQSKGANTGEVAYSASDMHVGDAVGVSASGSTAQLIMLNFQTQYQAGSGGSAR